MENRTWASQWLDRVIEAVPSSRVHLVAQTPGAYRANDPLPSMNPCSRITVFLSGSCSHALSQAGVRRDVKLTHGDLVYFIPMHGTYDFPVRPVNLSALFHKTFIRVLSSASQRQCILTALSS